MKRKKMKRGREGGMKRRNKNKMNYICNTVLEPHTITNLGMLQHKSQLG